MTDYKTFSNSSHHSNKERDTCVVVIESESESESESERASVEVINEDLAPNPKLNKLLNELYGSCDSNLNRFLSKVYPIFVAPSRSASSVELSRKEFKLICYLMFPYLKDHTYDGWTSRAQTFQSIDMFEIRAQRTLLHFLQSKLASPRNNSENPKLESMQNLLTECQDSAKQLFIWSEYLRDCEITLNGAFSRGLVALMCGTLPSVKLLYIAVTYYLNPSFNWSDILLESLVLTIIVAICWTVIACMVAVPSFKRGDELRPTFQYVRQEKAKTVAAHQDNLLELREFFLRGGDASEQEQNNKLHELLLGLKEKKHNGFFDNCSILRTRNSVNESRYNDIVGAKEGSTSKRYRKIKLTAEDFGSNYGYKPELFNTQKTFLDTCEEGIDSNVFDNLPTKREVLRILLAKNSSPPSAEHISDESSSSSLSLRIN